MKLAKLKARESLDEDGIRKKRNDEELIRGMEEFKVL